MINNSGRRTQSERREEAEGRIVAAAVKLLAEKGYDGFSLADLGEAAGYSRALPAHYFGKKDDLLSAVARNIITSFNLSRHGHDRSVRGLDALISLVKLYLDAIKTHSVDVKALHVILGAALTHPELREAVRALNDEARGGLIKEIRTGMKLGNIRQDIDPYSQAVAIASFLRGSVTFKLIDKTVDLDAVTAAFIADLKERLAPR